MKTVLVVEDSKAEQRLILALLQQVGLQVALSDTAESALSWLENNKRPDLIVLDIIMPGLSGLDLCRQIRSNPDLESIPIVFCSSKSQDFDRFWALRQGGNAYLTKPFDPSDLLDTVCEHLN